MKRARTKSKPASQPSGPTKRETAALKKLFAGTDESVEDFAKEQDELFALIDYCRQQQHEGVKHPAEIQAILDTHAAVQAILDGASPAKELP